MTSTRELLNQAKLEEQLLKNEKMKGNLVDAELMEKKYADLVTSFRERLLSIPNTVCRRLQNKKSAEIKCELLKEIEDALRELSY